MFPLCKYINQKLGSSIFISLKSENHTEIPNSKTSFLHLNLEPNLFIEKHEPHCLTPLLSTHASISVHAS